MYFTPTIFMLQLLAAMQVLMTLDMPLSTTMALPVTSKPIESTVENLAWQAWIELPPEQKQQVKSRKVTPKSIFSLPNRIDCPEGHKQVDTKCIPIIIGTSVDLLALNYLTLIAGNSNPEEQYDYDDVMEEELSYGPQMQIGEAEKSVDGLPVELKPPTKDEPLKFNIFESKFNIYQEEPMEDYSASISNEGNGQSSESNSTKAAETSQDKLNASVNITAINDLAGEPSNNTDRIGENSPPNLDSDTAGSNTFTTLADTTDFKVDAISFAATNLDKQKPHKLAIFQKDAPIQLVTTVMDTAATATTAVTAAESDKEQQQENDIQTLLQTESLLPLINQATATTILNTPLAESSALTTVAMDESSTDSFTLNIEEGEMTTIIPSIMEQEMASNDKMEYTRSVTMNPLMADDDHNNNYSGDDDDDEVKATTLETMLSDDEPLETTTAIQLDDTTIIENNIEISTPESLSFSTTSSSSSPDSSTTTATTAAVAAINLSKQKELKELLIKQEQALKDFEELQRMRKGQKDQHAVLKKSKVEPVEVLPTTTTTTTILTTAAAPSPAAKTLDELITAETVTPLLTVHNENDSNNSNNNNNNNKNNDRFYYQHIAKQDLEATPTNVVATKQRTSAELTSPPPPAALATKIPALTTTTEIEAMPTTVTSEIDPAEELRLINELVKGIQSPAIIIKTPLSSSTTTATTEIITTLTDDAGDDDDKLEEDVNSSSFTASSSESSLGGDSTIKPTLSTSQIWSKILPLLTTPQESSTAETTTLSSSISESPKSSAESKSFNDIKSSTTNEASSLTSNRSHRNSKIIRINGFNTISSSTTSTTTEDPITSSTTELSSSLSASSSDNSYDSYWWLPVAWRLDKSVSTENQPEKQQVKEEEQPLLLRFWSAYHAPKSS